MKAVSEAFLSGPMYDPLYSHESIISTAKSLGLRVDFYGDHPALNRYLSTLTEIPYDLISTHTKYAPSQEHFLLPRRASGPASKAVPTRSEDISTKFTYWVTAPKAMSLLMPARFSCRRRPGLSPATSCTSAAERSLVIGVDLVLPFQKRLESR
jgi:hypothetical protein